ncbi:unnamed protein product [Microthlaspi erraticum]|uniref:F-box associated beta-propeller type 3 domain-containing protein n=1 Tax=Microthlaspi erraticum TaxID=1685480 RepID=A0A6D2HYL8_9BRAS|nr:unnamed protein product [Microthlaspi erraticum]
MKKLKKNVSLRIEILVVQNFIESFLTKSLTCPRLLFAIQVDGKLFFSSSLQAPNPNNKTSSSLVLVDHQLYFPTDGSSKEFHHLNGLVYRQEQRKTQSVGVICHPSTGKSVTLPQVKTKKLAKTNGFIGFDPMEKQFKVLSITCYVVNIFHLPQEHRVMTLGNGQHIWRNIKNRKPHYPLGKEICINGVLYYLASISENSSASMIVCFDVRSEISSFIDIDAHMWTLSFNPTLTNYKGKLAAVRSTWRTLEFLFLEDAKKHKWSNRIYQLRPLCKSNEELYIVGMTGTGEIVFAPYFLSDPFCVYFYNRQ